MEELKQKLIDLKQALPIMSQLGGLDKSALKTITEELEQALFLYNVVNCVYVVTERDNYGNQTFKDVFANKEKAIEYLAEDGLEESNIYEINEIELN